MLDKNTRVKLKEVKVRINTLPSNYQVVFKEISTYLWQFASNDAGVVNIQVDILDMFETGAAEGKEVLDIVGNDVIGFCDGLLETIPEHTWMGKMKAAMNQSILKKLSKKKVGGK